jgi:hypothetical protein
MKKQLDGFSAAQADDGAKGTHSLFQKNQPVTFSDKPPERA